MTLIEHITVCTSPPATATWNAAVANLEKEMNENDSEPHMTQIICSSLRAWRNGEGLVPHPTTDIPQIVMEAMGEQDSIIWYNFSNNGFISKKWRIIQKAYLK